MDAGMVFALIFTVIVIGLVLVFGMGQIGSLFCMSSDAQVGKALDDIENVAFEVYNLAEGSSRLLKVSLPGDARLCFVNPESPETQLYTSSENWKNWVSDPVYESMIQERGYNIWYEMCSGKGGKKLPYISVPKNFCIEGGKNVYLENKGLVVDISA
jgi:hypothetical protein